MQISKIRKVGNSMGITLDQATLGRLHAGQGDRVVISASGQGEARLRVLSAHQAGMLERYQQDRDAWRDVLRELGDE